MKLKLALLLAILAAFLGVTSSAFAYNVSVTPALPTWNGSYITTDAQVSVSNSTAGYLVIQFQDYMYEGDTGRSYAYPAGARSAAPFYNGTVSNKLVSTYWCPDTGAHWWGHFTSFRVAENDGLIQGPWGPWHQTAVSAGLYLQCA